MASLASLASTSASTSTSTSTSDVASVSPATPTRIASENPSLPDTSSSSSLISSSYLKRTVVTAKRKEELLLEARADRKRWIRTIPLPYDPELLANCTSDGKTEGLSKEDATNRFWSSRESLDQFQSSLIFHDRLLHGATAVLAELYGISSALDDAGEEKDECNGNDGDMPKKRPLSVDDIADRVDRLTKPFLAGEEKEGHERPSCTNDKKDDDPKLENITDRGDDAQRDGEKDARDDRYKDVRTAYEEFMDAMLFPESAVTVQGMKNFVRQFAAAAGSKKQDEDDDKLVRKMALAVNGQIRSSYEYFATKNKNNNNNNNSITSNAQGQGHPDLDRRSLESFLYGQVKTVVDSTLDRIIGNGTAPPSPSSPFLMTQRSFDIRLKELQFLQPSHLELACLNDDSDDIDDPSSSATSQTKLEILLEGPIKALRSIESFYSPYEKLCRVLDIYYGVNAVLSKASKALPMADDVISTMILVIVKAASGQTKSKTKASTKASLKNLLRDLHFVENFATQEYKRVGGGEVEYAFTSLYGAVYFLQGVELGFYREGSDGGNKSSNNRLCISNEELRRGLEKSRALVAKNDAKQNTVTGGSNSDEKKTKGIMSRGVEELLEGISPGGIGGVGTEASAFVPIPRQLSVREVRAARLRGETLDLEWALRQKEEQPRYEEASAHTKSLPTSPTKSPSRSVFLPQRYTFLGVRPESIKLSDLPRLLDEYRKLVLSNEQLLGEQKRANNKIQSERKRLRDENHRRTLGENALLR